MLEEMKGNDSPGQRDEIAETFRRARRLALWVGAVMLGFCLVATTVLVVLDLQGCTPGQRLAARSALDAAQIACILAPHITTEEAAMRFCDGAESLREPIRTLLAGKSRREGVGACVSADAGVDH
jgi:hypothetical protein